VQNRNPSVIFMAAPLECVSVCARARASAGARARIVTCSVDPCVGGAQRTWPSLDLRPLLRRVGVALE
jgi:hypothetical protein